jgi:hypothetical protein
MEYVPLLERDKNVISKGKTLFQTKQMVEDLIKTEGLLKKFKKETGKEVNGVGKFYVARVATGLAPYNERGKTTYLVPRGSHVVAERVKSGYKLYLVGGIKDIPKKNLANYKTYVARRWEVNISVELYKGE